MGVEKGGQKGPEKGVFLPYMEPDKSHPRARAIVLHYARTRLGLFDFFFYTNPGLNGVDSFFLTAEIGPLSAI